MSRAGFATPKRHILAQNRDFLCILRENRCARLGCIGDWKNQKNDKAETKGCAKSRIRRNETPHPIWIKFWCVLGIPEIITFANFGEGRLRGFRVAGGQISPLSIDIHRHPYNTVALRCECVIADYTRL